ncbi:MAG TPA: hypothetical protein VL981_08275 [Candidatus Methylacidiphilales bacterium]|nr:hypothetical protein [Candidatus Methylacidiphilales bacterium]
MGDDPENPSREDPEPSRKERLGCWWQIYIGGCFFFPIFIGAVQSVILIPLVIIMLPIGLAFDFGGHFDDLFGQGKLSAVILELLTVPVAYFIFWLHLRLTSKVKTRREFRLLMLSLILLICASMIGCVRMVDRPIGLQ